MCIVEATSDVQDVQLIANGAATVIILATSDKHQQVKSHLWPHYHACLDRKHGVDAKSSLPPDLGRAVYARG